MKSQAKLKSNKHIPDISSPEFADWFSKAAKSFTTRATKSRKSALDTLIAEGIYTKRGSLSKNYR
jgi:hypothetical protein